MGVRLYPEGLSPEQMEELAKVPAGTWARLAAHEALRPKGWGEAEDRWYDILDHDPQMAAMHHFKVFGFGKLTEEAENILDHMDADRDCGHTSEYDRVQALIRAQGIHPGDIKAVSWS